MVTVTDVAREAGVSPGTVSNVLNHPHRVSSRTQARVRAVIADLGYAPNARARQLRTGVSTTVGLLIPDMGNPYFVSLAKAAERAARKAGLQVMVCTSAQSAEEEAEYLSFFSAQRVLGVLLSPVDDSRRALDRLRREEIPFVLMDRTTMDTDACSVAVDHRAGGRLATQHLVAAGHRSIVYVAGPGSLPQVRDRRAGALAALHAAGLPPTALADLPTTAMDVRAGRDAGARLLGLPNRPTAVFCANDLLALGVLQTVFAVADAPEQIAVVGYDDIEFAAAAVVPLSSVRQPASELGAQAVQMLMEEAAQHRPHEHSQVVLQPELVVRNSTITKP